MDWDCNTLLTEECKRAGGQPIVPRLRTSARPTRRQEQEARCWEEERERGPFRFREGMSGETDRVYKKLMYHEGLSSGLLTVALRSLQVLFKIAHGMSGES